MLTVKELRDTIACMPDDAEVLVFGDDASAIEVESVKCYGVMPDGTPLTGHDQFIGLDINGEYVIGEMQNG